MRTNLKFFNQPEIFLAANQVDPFTMSASAIIIINLTIPLITTELCKY